ARVGCHKGTNRPLGNVANEVLRLKRRETHQVFDCFWQENGMTRTQAYKWLARRMNLSEKNAHIGGFEMDQCQQVIDLCEKEWKEAAA
ncbi:MAG: zinc-finger-containing protein, partial [Eubacteriales bacterium]|nr:zinc-finger-containing protein [Eubacteriales bacterium]